MEKRFDAEKVTLDDDEYVVVKVTADDLKKMSFKDIIDKVNKQLDEKEKDEKPSKRVLTAGEIELLAMAASRAIGRAFYSELSTDKISLGIETKKVSEDGKYERTIACYRTEEKKEGDVLFSYTIRNY